MADLNRGSNSLNSISGCSSGIYYGLGKATQGSEEGVYGFTSKHFAVSIFLCRGKEVESEKLFDLDLGLAKTALCWGCLGDRFMVNNIGS